MKENETKDKADFQQDLDKLIESGKKKGGVLTYDEVNDTLSGSIDSSQEIDHVFEILDGLQVTALGALRGLTDTKRPMFMAIFSYLFVSLPVAYAGGFIFNMGEAGLMWGFAFGLLVAAILFIRRFSILTK